MEKNILDKLDSFSDSIVNSEEYKNFEKSTKKLDHDLEAQKLLSDFNEKQMSFTNSGFDEELWMELHEMQINLNKNETISNFIKSQNILIDLIKRANNLISSRIGTPFVAKKGGCC